MLCLALQDLAAPTDPANYPTYAVVIMAVAALRFAEAVLARVAAKARGAEDLGYSAGDRELAKKTESMTRQLLHWHSPDASGRQEWRNPEIARLLREILEELRDRRDPR